MKVTAINRQQRQVNRYSIFIDGKYKFSLNEDSLLGSGLSVNKEVSRQELSELKSTAQFDKLYILTLSLLSRRKHSEWEVRTYLKRKEAPALLIDKILNKLSDGGWINDLDFAKSWIESKRLIRPTSLRRLRYELQKKYVDKEFIERALSDIEIDEKAVLKNLISIKKKQTRYSDRTKLMQYLLRQGFKYDDIKEIL